MASINENFKILNDRLLKELCFDSGLVECPVFSTEPASLKKLIGKIQAGMEHFTPIYRKGYIEPLLANANEIIEMLLPRHVDKDEDAAAYAYLACLVNAAVQPAQDSVGNYLRPVQEIVNDMYNSFLTSRKRLGITGPLDQNVPPLVGFVGKLPASISSKAPLPSTFELEQMRDEKDWLGKLAQDFTAGVVLLPAGYLEAPLLWGVLGHEVGGHYTLTADQDSTLLTELRDKIYEEVLRKYPSEKELAALWLHWTEETAADVCAILNLGPSFGIGAIHFYTAQLKLGGWWDKTELLEAVFYKLNRHPTPVLIPYVIIGAVEELTQLTPSRKFRYIAQLEEIARTNTRGQQVLTFPNSQTLENKEGKPITLPKEQPLKLMQKSARHVGSYIATVPLNALDGHTLQELATWDDGDEDAAIDVANQLMKPESSSAIHTRRDKPKGLQLFSGGILAMIRAPESYGRINEILLKELGVNSTAAKMKR